MLRSARTRSATAATPSRTYGPAPALNARAPAVLDPGTLTQLLEPGVVRLARAPRQQALVFVVAVGLVRRLVDGIPREHLHDVGAGRSLDDAARLSRLHHACDGGEFAGAADVRDALVEGERRRFFDLQSGRLGCGVERRAGARCSRHRLE